VAIEMYRIAPERIERLALLSANVHGVKEGEAAVPCTTLLSRDLAASFSISTGNEAPSGGEDYVDWLVDDPATYVIAMIVEQFRLR
jgi:hypothetical protein